MGGVSAGKLGDADNLVDRQVAFDRAEVAGKVRPAADPITFVRFEAVQRHFVLFSPYRDRFRPSSFAARKTRMAVSERLATNIFEMSNAVSSLTGATGAVDRSCSELTSILVIGRFASSNAQSFHGGAVKIGQ